MALEFLMMLDRLPLLPGLGENTWGITKMVPLHKFTPCRSKLPRFGEKRLGNNQDGFPCISSRLSALSYRDGIRILDDLGPIAASSRFGEKRLGNSQDGSLA
ncbi:hypothetical protein CDAR_63421 [Caerostris darwini]|uniref:Uncharacterized protein n=1 Tax=Caerostris darwini TaxID=1538125 RepID=A0AAV4QKG0_9ARAC|nr:hypothetical protein CDAR_63421 [Caerostris darwini]